MSDPRHHLFFYRCFFVVPLIFRSIVPWISFFVVFVLGFRVRLFLGIDQARHTRAAPGPIPPQTTRAAACRFPSERLKRSQTFVLKSFMFLTSFFFVCSSILKSKMGPKMNQKQKNTSQIDLDFKPFFQRFVNALFCEFGISGTSKNFQKPYVFIV